MQAEAGGQVLIVGAQQVGKYSLVSRLLHPAQALKKQSESRQSWQLDTKYYTTAVTVKRFHPSQHATEEALVSQGLLLVFDASSEASFHTVSQWAEQLPSSTGDIRLCIANRVDQLPRQQIITAETGPNSQRDSWLQNAQLWSADNQFEYIEASSTDCKLDESLVWEEQQQGICRIKQALEANYWPDLQLKKQPQNPASQVASSQQFSHTAVDKGQHHSFEVASDSSGSSEAEFDGFDAFQSADEADLDQFDKMFGELRGMSTCRDFCLVSAVV